MNVKKLKCSIPQTENIGDKILGESNSKKTILFNIYQH